MVDHLGPAGPGSRWRTARPVLVEGARPDQLTQALANAERLLADHGPASADVVKTTVFVTDMGDFAAVNEAYSACFGDHRPARSVVGVAGPAHGGRGRGRGLGLRRPA